MWPIPDSPALVQRVREAYYAACTALDAAPIPDTNEVWGWQGRTLSKTVTTVQGRAWLRLASTETSQLINTFWNGTIDAQRRLPSTIPRPQLRRWHDWADSQHSYRGELYDYITTNTISTHAVATTPTDLPTSWWNATRKVLDEIAAVPTTRLTVQPAFLTWAMPHYLGTPADQHGNSSWTTAHGDFHLANLCAPDLTILDWEGWGLAPSGYDAATLHSYSLLTPQTAHQINTELAHQLHTPAGQYAELAVITELLHAANQGINPALAPSLRSRATKILDRNPAPTGR